MEFNVHLYNKGVYNVVILKLKIPMITTKSTIIVSINTLYCKIKSQVKTVETYAVIFM